MNNRPALIAFIRRLSELQPTVAEALTLAEENQVGLDVLLEHVEFDEEPGFSETPELLVCLDVWPEDWLASLVEYVGGIAPAQALLDKTHRYATIDIAWCQRKVSLQSEIRAGLAGDASAGDLVSLILQGRGELDFLYHDVAQQLPVLQVVQTPSLPVDVVREVLLKRLSLAEVADALMDEMNTGDFLANFKRIFGVVGIGESAKLELLDLRLGIQISQNQSLWELVPFARRFLDTPVWLGCMRKRGFSANFGALAALEDCSNVIEAARVMICAGYGDTEILGGFRASGVTHDRILVPLSRVGWEPARLVGALRASQTLDPEIRESLRVLGLPNEQIASLLRTEIGHEYDPS